MNKRVEEYIARACAAGSTASTLRGAGKYILSRAGNARLANHELATAYDMYGPLYGPAPRWGYDRVERAPKRILATVRLSRRQARSQRLIARYAGLSRMPAYLSSEDRAAITGSAEHRDVVAMRALPSYVRAYYITPAIEAVPRFAKELTRARKGKGNICDSPICAAHADANYPWGALRVHRGGESVPPAQVGTRTTGSNSNWHKRSTLQRYTDYCLIYPAKHPRVWTGYYLRPAGFDSRTQNQSTAVATVYRTTHYMQIAGEEPRRITPRSASATKSWPVHIQRRLLAAAAPSVLRVDYDRDNKQLTLVDSRGEVYHSDGNIRTPADAYGLVGRAIAAFRRRRAERVKALDEAAAQRLYVSLDDSYAAGNCRSMSDQFATRMWAQIGAQGPAAVRADVILAARHDSYTLRACAFAAARG